jgi:hypothetical protein
MPTLCRSGYAQLPRHPQPSVPESRWPGGGAGWPGTSIARPHEPAGRTAADCPHSATAPTRARPVHQVMVLLMRHAIPSRGPPPAARRRRVLSLFRQTRRAPGWLAQDHCKTTVHAVAVSTRSGPALTGLIRPRAPPPVSLTAFAGQSLHGRDCRCGYQRQRLDRGELN